MGLITITEANVSLDEDVYPDWEALDDPFKQRHINRASSKVRLSWTYDDADFDWDDDATWVAGTKDAIARFADADRAGLLYGDSTPGADSNSPVKKRTQKIGSLETTVEYAQPDVRESYLGVDSINDEMLALGYTRILKPGRLVRV